MGVVVPLEEARDPAAKLAPLLALTSEGMARVNRIILDKAGSNVELIPELARHLIDSGGKRLRPMLTLAAARLCGYDGDGHVLLARGAVYGLARMAADGHLPPAGDALSQVEPALALFMAGVFRD